MRVRIIGGGVAGLSCALALRLRAGIDDVQVFEREPCAEVMDRAGHGLLLMQNGAHALRRLAVAHLLQGCTALSHAMLQDKRGVVMRTNKLRDVYCITRAALVDGLRAGLPPGTIAFDRRCTGVEFAPASRGACVRAVHFASGPPLLGDAVDMFVGADGWRSPLRSALNPTLQHPASRVKEIVTSTRLPRLAARLRSCFVKTILPDQGAAFGLLAPTGTRVIGFLQFDSDRYKPPAPSATAADIRHFLDDVLSGAPEPVPTYLRHADLETAHLWEPVNADIPARLHCDNAVLVGDAAHPLLPFTSQGAGAALEDSIILADAMRSVGAERQLVSASLDGSLARSLARFCDARRREVAVYIEGGRRILANFLDPSSGVTLPYVDGAVSGLGERPGPPRARLTRRLQARGSNGDSHSGHDEPRDGSRRSGWRPPAPGSASSSAGALR